MVWRALTVVAWWVLTAPTQAQSPSRVAVTVLVDSLGMAHVQQQYRLADTATNFRVLQRACASIGDVQVTSAGVRRTIAPTPRGPWLEFIDSSSATSAPTTERALAYDVQVTGWEGDIPLVHLTRPIPNDENSREGAVEVTVQFAPGRDGSVSFPQLMPTREGVWTGRFVAVPAFLHVSGLRMTRERCAPPGREPNDGGLAWRFWLLAAIMIVWVPLYLLWARRSEDRAS
ncbi:MAG: hypothetical protein U0132_15935 [Gemmatimonadaceae bacterium]